VEDEKMRTSIYIFLMVITILFYETGASFPSTVPNAAEDSLVYTPRKEKLSTFERSFKPSNYDTEVYLFKKNDTSRTVGTSIDQFTSAPAETLHGFRVQLLSSQVYDVAVASRDNLIAAFPDLWVYMVYEAPSFKIRVGDFTNRSDANVLVNELSKMGYKDGWVVPDKIIKNQLPKPPLPVPIDSTSIDKF
jgi:hypothetical protein